jgi:hypothetical protein
MRTATTAVLLLFSAGAAFAQRAPRETATATIAGKKVSIEYGRAALKGRSLDELMKQLPADRVWRAGVDQVSTLATEADLVVGGKKVPAGRYSVYVHCPESGDYSLILNKDLGVPLGKIWAAAPANLANEPWPHLQNYQENVGKLEVVRAPMKKNPPAAASVDLLTYTLAPAKDGSRLTIAWGTESWSLEIMGAK